MPMVPLVSVSRISHRPLTSWAAAAALCITSACPGDEVDPSINERVTESALTLKPFSHWVSVNGLGSTATSALRLLVCNDDKHPLLVSRLCAPLQIHTSLRRTLQG